MFIYCILLVVVVVVVVVVGSSSIIRTNNRWNQVTKKSYTYIPNIYFKKY